MSAADENIALSERSFGSMEGLGINGTGQLKLNAFRNKHAQCIEALKRKAGSLATESPLPRQPTANSVDGASDCGAQSVKSDHFGTAQDITKELAELRSISMQQSRILEGLGSADVAAQAEEIQKMMQTLGQELQAIRSQDTSVGLRALRETVETCDKMNTQRLQDTRTSLDRLKDSISAQGREIDSLKGQGQQPSLKSLSDILDAQGDRIFKDLKPACQEMTRSLAGIGQAVQAHEGQLQELGSQLQLQHQGHLDEIQKLRAGLVLQAQCEVMRSEIEALRRSEAAHRTATGSWLEERRRLEGEVARLQQGGGAGAADPEKAPGRESPMTGRSSGSPTLAAARSPRAGAKAGSRFPRDPVPLALAAALGGVVPVVLSRLLKAATGFVGTWPPAPASRPVSGPLAPPSSSPPLPPPGRLEPKGRLGSVGRLGAAGWQRVRATPRRRSRPQVVGAQ